MSLRAEYALGHSPFNAFLYAFVGEEKNGLQLTVLSAFARLGLDPWGEADRLSRMPKAAAAQSMESVIARLPQGAWTAAESPSIARRLVDCLPAYGAAPSRAAQGTQNGTAPPVADSARWLWRAALAAAAVLVFMNLFGGG